MRTIMTVGGVLALTLLAGVVFCWPVQRGGPEAIAYGRDACAHCRMHVSQAGFAGELRDADGRLTKYDDIGCLLHAMARAHREFPEVWVQDHDSGQFIALLAATLVQVDHGATPMGSGLVAFASDAGAVAYARDNGGTTVALEEIIKNPLRIARGSETETHAQAR